MTHYGTVRDTAGPGEPEPPTDDVQREIEERFDRVVRMARRAQWGSFLIGALGGIPLGIWLAAVIR